VVLVNGKTLKKNSKVILVGGDEVVFSSSGKYAYVSSSDVHLPFQNLYASGVWNCYIFLFGHC